MSTLIGLVIIVALIILTMIFMIKYWYVVLALIAVFTITVLIYLYRDKIIIFLKKIFNSKQPSERDKKRTLNQEEQIIRKEKIISGTIIASSFITCLSVWISLSNSSALLCAGIPVTVLAFIFTLTSILILCFNSKIRKSSKIFSDIISLNEGTLFYDIKTPNAYFVINSYKGNTIENEIDSLIQRNYDEYAEIFKKIEHNKKELENYNLDFAKIEKKVFNKEAIPKTKIPLSYYFWYEKYLLKALRKGKPTIEFKAKFYSIYGEKSFIRKKRKASFEQIEKCFTFYYMLKNGECLKIAKELNSSVKFNANLNRTISLTVPKGAISSFDYNKYLVKDICFNLSLYEKIIDRLNKNEIDYNEYSKKFDNIKCTDKEILDKQGIDYIKFTQKERACLNKLKIKSRTTVASVIICVREEQSSNYKNNQIGFPIWSHIFYRVKEKIKDNTSFNNMVKLNSKYQSLFKEIKSLNYNETLETKRAFDMFDVKVRFFKKYTENKAFFDSIVADLTKNSNVWKEYNEKFNIIREDFKKSILNVETNDILAFDSYKLKMSNVFKIVYKWSYTSPAGINSYSDRVTISDKEFISYVEEFNKILSLNEAEQIKKQAEKERQKAEREKEIAELKRERAETLKAQRELKKDKEQIEKKVAYVKEQIREEGVIEKKKEALEKKEKEFEMATKGHIYTTLEMPYQQKQISSIKKEESTYQKLKKLKMQLDAGEITIEEYSKLRNELL